MLVSFWRSRHPYSLSVIYVLTQFSSRHFLIPQHLRADLFISQVKFAMEFKLPHVHLLQDCLNFFSCMCVWNLGFKLVNGVLCSLSVSKGLEINLAMVRI